MSPGWIPDELWRHNERRTARTRDENQCGHEWLHHIDVVLVDNAAVSCVRCGECRKILSTFSDG